MLIVNDPFLGGTHLPDVTLIAPVHVAGRLVAFVANRAHHADIGAHSPGSMPVSCRLEEEGMVIPPMRLLHRGRIDGEGLAAITDATANPRQMQGDLAAQISANRTGCRRLAELVRGMGDAAFLAGLDAVNEYGARLARHALRDIPDGSYHFRDVMDDDGMGNRDIPIAVNVRVDAGRVEVDFSGTAAQVRGNINCPLPVTAAGVYYVFRCLMPGHTPACAGSLQAIRLRAPPGCLLNARRPAAVAAGNVETSSRVVDVVMGALAQALPERIPAASQGTMNNLAMGAHTGARVWDYYETIAGGMGAGFRHDGLSATQSHMTNTLNTPIEVLEMNYPLRLPRYSLRDHSGGAGWHRGGDGVVREYLFLEPATVTLIGERRRHGPWGLAGGRGGAAGENWKDGARLPAKTGFAVAAGERLRICTPGGGGWGSPAPEADPDP
jgi:N-methylhydantoinase B